MEADENYIGRDIETGEAGGERANDEDGPEKYIIGMNF
jgi:hypothetical protein